MTKIVGITENDLDYLRALRSKTSRTGMIIEVTLFVYSSDDPELEELEGWDFRSKVTEIMEEIS